MGGDVQVRRGERSAGQVFALGHSRFQSVEYVLKAAVAYHFLPLLGNDQAERVVAGGGFEWAGGEEGPAVVCAARPISGWGRKPRLREGVGEIRAYRGGLGHDHVAV